MTEDLTTDILSDDHRWVQFIERNGLLGTRDAVYQILAERDALRDPEPDKDTRILASPGPFIPEHPLPDPSNVQINTVARCTKHGEVFVARVSADHYGNTAWFRLRWYHITAQRLLKEGK